MPVTDVYSPARIPERCVLGLSESFSEIFSTENDVPTIVHSYTIPALGLGNDGDSLEYEFHGTWLGASSATSHIVLTLSELNWPFDTGAFQPVLAGHWLLTGRIARESLEQALFWSKFESLDLSTFAGGPGGADFSTPQDLTLTITGHDHHAISLISAVLNFRGGRV